MTFTLPAEADAWARDLGAALDESSAFGEAAADLTATIRFTVEPDDHYDGEPVHIRFTIDDGACPTAEATDDTTADYALSGPYDAWRRLLDGELSASSAVMGGPFTIEGSTLDLLSHRAAFEEMIDAARASDVEFSA